MENLPIHVDIKHYIQLSLDEFHDMIALRMAVFVVEQNLIYYNFLLFLHQNYFQQIPSLLYH